MLLNDLVASWNGLCNQHGGPFPSSNSINSIYNTTSVLTGRLGTIQEFKNLVESQTGATNTYSGTYYSDNTPAYTVSDTKINATPKLAYILNYMQEGVASYKSGGSYTAVQKAWYGATGQGMSSGILNEANAYEKFVKQIADTSKMVNKSHTFQNDDGTTTDVTIKFPEIKKDKLISSKFDKVTVSIDKETSQYVIGPITLNYAGSISNGKDLGGISNFEIYTDASSEPVDSSQWSFVRTKENRKSADYPDSGEKFYIRLDYIEGATKITNINVEYKYLIAGAQYHHVTGTFDKSKWHAERETHTTTNADGTTSTTYTWKLVNYDHIYSIASQKLVFADKAARWYETEKISILTETEGTLVVEKVALDENGKKLTADEVKEKFGEYQYFNFNVKVKYADGTVDEHITTVRAGESAIAGTYAWKNGEKAPTYEVSEVKLPENSEWKFVSIKNGKGSLEFSKDTCCGTVNIWSGSGGLSVELEKPFIVPTKYAHTIQVEGSKNNNGYTVDEIFGLTSDCWNGKMTFTNSQPSLYKENEEELISYIKSLAEKEEEE